MHLYCVELCDGSGVERVLWAWDEYPCLNAVVRTVHDDEEHGLDALTSSVQEVDVLVGAREPVTLRDELSNVLTDDLDPTRF